MALNIVGFPSKVLGLEVLKKVLKGGFERTRASGAFLVGGHSVQDEEPKYGLVGAICAAPLFVIDKMEEFHGKSLCLYPDLAKELKNTTYKDADVFVDGKLITGKGPSKAMKFALAILENVYGKAVAQEAAVDLLFE